MFHLFKKKEKIKRELPPGTIRKEFHFEGNVQNIGFRFEIQSHAMPKIMMMVVSQHNFRENLMILIKSF